MGQTPPVNLLELGAPLAALAGCIAIYLASPHQRWLDRPWPTAAARGLGVGLLLLSAWLFTQRLQLLTLIYTQSALLMLVFALLPYLGALRRPQGRSR